MEVQGEENDEGTWRDFCKEPHDKSFQVTMWSKLKLTISSSKTGIVLVWTVA